MDWTLLAIVDAAFVPEDTLERSIAAAARGGATWLQIRGKALATGDLLRYARVAARAAREANVPLLINDRVDVALAAGADGVHLGEEDLPVAEARKLLGLGRLIGRTARDPKTARRAETEGADYLGVGPQFGSATKPALVPLPEGRTAEIRRASSLPLVGIGGIDPSNAPVAARRGLDGIAVISALWAGNAPEEAARRLVRGFREGREA
ncbi:MAG: thiamine phosphate synthase [Candidatus Eisenbacteria bacterium]